MSNSLIALYGDTQQESHPQYSYIGPNGRSVRFEENLDTNKWVLQDAARRGAVAAHHLGDGVENKNPNSLEMQALAELFGEGIRLGLEQRVVAGNHDGAAFDVSGSAFKPLEIVSAGALKVYHTATYDPKLQALFIPYLHNASHEEIRDAVRAAYVAPFGGDWEAFYASVAGRRCIFAEVHYGFKGARAGARNLVLPGDYLGEEELGDYVDVAFGGHIHKGQDVRLGNIRAYHPGSTVVCDIGERDDVKSYLLFDPETRAVERIPIPQRRRWVVAAWPPEINEEPVEGGDGTWLRANWTDGDIVKFEGERDREESPTTTMQKLIEAGAPRPFVFDVSEIKLKKPERRARDFGVDITKGPREACLQLAAKRYPEYESEPAQAAGVERALAVIRESALPVWYTTIRPLKTTARNILTFRDFTHEYEDGVTLYTGENGRGKTNFGDLQLFCLTGETSKGVETWQVVRQGEKEGWVSNTYLGTTPEGEEHVIQILRTVKLAFSTPESRPKVTETIKIDRLIDDVPDAEAAKALNDGGKAERQQRIAAIFGGSYTSLRVTNFQQQKTTSRKAGQSFIDTDPAERKAVISEVRGDENLIKAWKRLDEQRQEAERARNRAEDKLQGMEAAVDAAGGKDEELQELLEVRAAAVTEAEAKMGPAEQKHRDADLVTVQAENALRAIEDEIRALPNTQAERDAAGAAKAQLDTNHTRNRAAKLEEHRTTKARLDGIEAELAALDAPTEDHVKALENAASAAARVHAEYQLPDGAPNRDELTRLRGVEAGLVKDLGKLQAENITECPTCKQAVDSSHLKAEIERVTRELGEARAEIQRLAAEDAAAADARRQAEAKGKELADAAREAAAALQRAREAFTKPAALQGQATATRAALGGIVAAGEALNKAYADDVTAAEARIQKAQEAHEAGEALRAQLLERKKTAEAELETKREVKFETGLAAQQARQALENARRDLEQVQRDIERLRLQAEAMQKARQDLAEARDALTTAAVAADLLNPKDGLPVVMIDDDLLFIEDRMNEFFAKLGGEILEIEVSSRVGERETLDILIDNGRPGPRLDAACFSGGQRDRIQIAAQRALAELKTMRRRVTFEYLGIDEPTGGLNTAGKNALATMLYEDAATYKVIALTSHDPEFRQQFSRRIEFIAGPDQETVINRAAA